MKILFSIVLFVFLAPVFTSAVNINYTPLAPIPGTGDCPTSDPNCLPAKVQNLGGYLRGIYMTGVALAGLFVVFSIVRGGFTLLFTDSVLGKTEGKGMILHALGGLLIVFSSFLLMNTINPQLGRDLNLNLAFPQKNITAFTGTVKPLTQAELDAMTLRNQTILTTKRHDLAKVTTADSIVRDATAHNSRLQAVEFRSQADELEKKPSKTPEEVQTIKDLRTNATDLDAAAKVIEIDSILAHTAAIGNDYYTKGSIAAQNSEQGGVNTQVNYETAQKYLTDSNTWYARNISTLETQYKNDPQAIESIAALYEHKITQDSSILSALAGAKINEQMVGEPTKFMQTMSDEANAAVAKLQVYKTAPGLSQAAKDAIDKSIGTIRTNATGMINATKSKCSAATLSCRNWVPATR